MMLKFIPRCLLSLFAVFFCLGVSPAHGQEKPSPAQIEKWRKAAERGDPLSSFYLGSHYDHGNGVQKDAEKAVEYYRKAAKQGLAVAQMNLGSCYARGSGVHKDQAQALSWYRKAAEKGEPVFSYILGSMFIEGNILTRDAAEAIKWLKKSAEQGYTDAQCKLGDPFVELPLADKERLKWLKIAAEQQNIRAQNLLGTAYSFGIFYGVKEDKLESFKWYRRAADQGDADAMSSLGGCHENGWGVPVDSTEAVKWYRKAAERGNGGAQKRLGICYADGIGVIKNDVEAYKWLLISLAESKIMRPFDDKIVQIIEKRLSIAQRAEGQRLAQEWAEAHAKRNDANEAGKLPTAPNEPKVTGTGFLITRNGYLVTNYHVVKGCDKVRVQTAAGLLDATVVRVDAAQDLALLRVNGVFDALPVVSSRTARLGAMVATVGFPNIGLQGFEPKLSKGDISSLAGVQDDVRYFQISVPVQPGNSGGALVDEHGNVVGVVSAQLSQKAALESTGTLAQNVNYAVKSSYLLSFLEAVPEASAGMLDAKTNEQKFESVVDDVKKATVLIIGY